MPSSPALPRRCFNCGGAFTPAKTWQRFCRVACRVDYNNNIGRFDIEGLREENARLRAENSSLKQHIQFGRKLPDDARPD